MPVLSATYSAAIPGPIQRVFELLTEPGYIPQWLPGCKAVEPAGALRKGSKIQVSFGSRTAELEIVELSPPHNFGWIERRGRPGQRTYFNLAFGGGSTKLTMKAVWEPRDWKAWLQAKIHRRRDAKRLFEGVVNNLRKIVTT